MGWLSAVCLWTTAHLPSPICLQKTITQKQSLPHRSLSVRLYLSALFISPLQKYVFFCLCTLSPVQQQEGRKRPFHFHRLTVFENVFIMMIPTFRYITQKRTSAEREREKKGGKQAEGKIEPNPSISSQSCTLLINGWLVYQSLTDDCCF